MFLWDLARSRPPGPREGLERFLGLLWMLPMACFAVTGLLGRRQGLHWYAPYLPFFLMWISFRLDDGTLAARLRQLKRVSGTLLLVVAALLLAPDRLLPEGQRRRFGFEYQLATSGRAGIVDRLASELNARPGTVLLTDGYTLASNLWVALRERGIDQDVSLYGCLLYTSDAADE